MEVREDSIQAQVERILHSDTFRNSGVLQRLLKFLAEKSLTADGDQLKEYVIGIDALGKPSSYDPRQDSVVRIQVGRLRHKLDEYYRTEGKDDPVVVDLPKGQFKIHFGPRPPPAVPKPAEVALQVVETKPTIPWRTAALGLTALLIPALAWGLYSGIQLFRAHQSTAQFRAVWTPELNDLWKPFLVPNRPLILAVSAPLFVGFQGAGYFRDLSINRWEDARKSPKIEALAKALKNPTVFPRHNYTGIGQVSAAFQLGRLLTVSPIDVSIVKSNQLSWQQLSDNNVLFIGPPRIYIEQLRELPAELEFVFLEEKGIQNLHPQPGEPATLKDDFPSILSIETSSVPDNGEVYALITHTPGPLGTGDILIFSANHNPGTLAAVQWFTIPNLAKILAGRLRKPNGELPRYYQVVLKVKYKDAVPTEVSYVMHRELHGEKRPANGK